MPLHFVAWIFTIGLMFPGIGIVSGQATSTGSGQATSTGSGQAYPSKPIRIVTAEPGGGNDLGARLIAPGLAGSLGQPVIVENRGGAGGLIATETVVKAPPDGYSLLLYGANVWLIPLLRSNVSYDTLRDLAPITLAATSPLILVVHPSLPVQSVKELVVLAKARPGQLNYGSGGTGSQTHLGGELFKSMAGVDIVRIAYKGNGPALADVMAGQLQMMFVTTGTAGPHAKSGRLRALAVTSTRPSALAPGLPPVATSGLPGFEAVQLYGLFAPAKTSPAIISRLNREIVEVLNKSDVKEKFFNNGIEVVGSTPEEYAAAIRLDVARMGKVIKDAGIREE